MADEKCPYCDRHCAGCCNTPRYAKDIIDSLREKLSEMVVINGQALSCSPPVRVALETLEKERDEAVDVVQSQASVIEQREAEMAALRNARDNLAIVVENAEWSGVEDVLAELVAVLGPATPPEE